MSTPTASPTSFHVGVGLLVLLSDATDLAPLYADLRRIIDSAFGPRRSPRTSAE